MYLRNRSAPCLLFFRRLTEKYRGLWKNFEPSGRWYHPLFQISGNMFGSVLTAAIGGMVNFAVSGIDMLLGAVDSLTVVLGGCN